MLNLSGLKVEPWSSLAQASDASVIQLFRFSAQRGRFDFEITEQNYRQVAEICALVEGMPLGVELAASWVSSLTLAEITRGIQDSIDFLKTEFHDVPVRHRRMRTVLEQSLHLLSDVEQHSIIQLCVFHNGFTAEAAKAVTGATLTMLSTLVNKALLQRDLQGRYSIHELLRQYGQAMLDPKICSRHASYYCQLLAEIESELISGDAESACWRIEPEFANIRIAWDWASRHEMYDELDASCMALACFREYRSRYIESNQIFNAAVHQLRQSAASVRRDVALADLLSCQSWTALRFGHLEEGLQRAQESWDLFTRHQLMPTRSYAGDPRHAMTVLHTLLGNLDISRQMGQEALQLYNERKDALGVGLTCYTLTVVELAAGNYQSVERYAINGYEAFRKAKHAYLQAYLLMNWANSERALGHLKEAKRLFRESYDNMCRVGTTIGQATALTHLAQLALAHAEYEEARRIFEGNIETFRQSGDSGGLADTLEGLARIAIAQKQYRRAAQLLVEALNITGTRLQSYTLSLLLCACQLPLPPQLRAQVLNAIHSYPAANEEIKRKATMRVDAMHDVLFPLDQLATEIKRHLVALEAQADQPDALTEREKDILRLVAEGLSNQEIAGRLVMTVGTIKWYLNHMYSKFNVKNRTEAVLHARKYNLLS